MPEKDAPGIQAYREELTKALGELPVTSLLHEQIIAKLDEAGKTFHILVLKTNLTLPYTSVFFQLQCGYWTAEAEANLEEYYPKISPLSQDTPQPASSPYLENPSRA